MGHRLLRTVTSGAAAIAITLAVSHCGSSGDDSQFRDGSSGASGTSGSSGASGTSGSSGMLGSSGSSGGASGNGGGEICDGIDNDGNGIIDDIDVGNDGVCDCLRIATLGIAGTWGQGEVFAKWLNGKSVKGAVGLEGQVLTKALLDQFQVIVAQNVSAIGRTYAAEEVAALNEWINAGGGLLTLIGYGEPPERTNVNALLAPTGISYGAAQILQKVGGSTVPVSSWIAHPVTQGVNKIGVDNGYPVEGGGTALANEQGHIVLRAAEQSKGHVIVWGDEWITYNSEWADHADYQVERFWLNMLKWLTPANECQVAIPPSVK